MTDYPEMTLSSSPHVRHADSTRTIMRDVILALLPALGGAVWFFGLRALMLALVSAAGCVFFEWFYRKLMHLD